MYRSGMNKAVFATGLATAATIGMPAQSAEALSVSVPAATEQQVVPQLGKSCDVVQAVNDVVRRVADETEFSHPVPVGRHAESYLKVFQKDEHGKIDEDKGFISNPLAITCGKKVLRYVGVTMARDNYAPGTAHRVGSNALLDVQGVASLSVQSISPKRAIVQEENRNYISLKPNKKLKINLVNRTMRFVLHSKDSSPPAQTIPSFTGNRRDYGQVF